MKSTMLNNYINYYQITKVSFFISSECYHLDFFVSRVWFYVQLAVQCSVRIFVPHCRVHRCSFVVLIDRSRRLKWCNLSRCKVQNGSPGPTKYMKIIFHWERIFPGSLDFVSILNDHDKIMEEFVTRLCRERGKSSWVLPLKISPLISLTLKENYFLVSWTHVYEFMKL